MKSFTREEIELLQKVVIPGVIKQMGEQERKKDRRFHVVCHVIAGINLASGNVPGWLVCTGISGAYALMRKIKNR